MNLTAGLNSNQKLAVEHNEGACVVVSSAGSGKTTVLTKRIANLIQSGVDPKNILAVTFTKKASIEMSERLETLIGGKAEDVTMGTFHSVCFQIARDNYKNVKFDLAQDWWQLKTAKEIMGSPSTKNPHGLNINGYKPRQLLGFISYQKNNLRSPKDELIMKGFPAFMEDKMRKAYALYEKLKVADKKIDFDDMLTMAYVLLRDKKDVREYYQDKFHYILVDEYQDTNIAQEEILKLLSGKHKNIFVVGDDKQSLYSFRGGVVDLIIDFEKNWDAKVIPLNINYRSTHNIVEWSNRLIGHNTKQLKIDSVAHKPEYEDPIVFMAHDEDEEAEMIAKEIETIMAEGYKPDDFAILYRTNAQSRPLEEQMVKRNIPYVLLGSQNFYNRKEIKDIIAYLVLAKNPHIDHAFERIVNVPSRYLGKAYVELLNRYANSNGLSLYDAVADSDYSAQWRYKQSGDLYNIITRLHDMCESGMKPKELIGVIRKITGYDDHLLSEDSLDPDGDMDKLDNLNQLQNSAGQFNTVSEFLTYVDSMSRETKDTEEKGKVKLMTIHRSKGLEFPVVFLSGVTDGILPHGKADSEEEERRVCYVGMTRAEKLLYMSYTQFYAGQPVERSTFIDEASGYI